MSSDICNKFLLSKSLKDSSQRMLSVKVKFVLLENDLWQVFVCSMQSRSDSGQLTGPKFTPLHQVTKLCLQIC